ncbi:MAG: TonB-dependent receptor plug domain-containing protein, partial [Pseudomonadota bacterium]|nr:TonB-dependent receptor plug domain-containing protein [Pseudomonadota bacterium]
MKFQRKKVATALGCALGLSGAMLAGNVLAASDIRVDVTGTNIPRVEGEQAVPVTVFTREELQRSGIQTAQELLERVSINQSFGNFTEAKGEGSTLVGFTGASLRGFGYSRTLVLLNGKRIAPYALSGGQGVDLSSIPIAALERIEILKDGASAVYGTDAIAGVINFITRKDFTGAEVAGTYLRTDERGGDSWRANATLGFGDLSRDRINAFVTFDHLKQKALKAGERTISETAYLPGLGLDRTSGNSLPGNISQPGGFSGTRNPTIPLTGATAASCLPPFSFPTVASPRQCRFNFASVIETIPESEKDNVIGRITAQLSPNHQFFLEGTYYRGKFIQRISPTPVSSAFTQTPISLPPTSPFYPTAYVAGLPGGNTSLPLLVSYRALELGPRTDEAKVDQERVVGGFQGTIWNNWDYAISANYTANKQIDTYKGGYISEARFAPLFRSGVINPFGFNSPAVLAQMQATQITGDASNNKAKNYGADAKLSKELFNLPAGAVAMAVGGEVRKEFLSQINAPFLSSGDIIGGAGAITSLEEVTRKVYA